MKNPLEQLLGDRESRAAVDPELRRGLRGPLWPAAASDLLARVASQDTSGRVEPGVRHQLARIEGPGGPLEIHLYRPQHHTGRGALLWLHGGGRTGGSASGDHQVCSELAARSGSLVASVDYRLAPQHPYPAALDDAWAALNWLHEHAEDLDLEGDRIAVGGASAGGGLAAELAQRARDGLVPVVFQLLVYPMLDDHTTTSRHPHRGRFGWTPEQNVQAWEAYLGHPVGQEETRPWAVAARCHDVRGLPPAWIGVGDLDLFLDEDLAYASRLKAAGVTCDVLVVPGMYHGADTLPGKRGPLMTEFRRRMAEALQRHVG
ncbi:alpha/beta hydrolase fold domain-containing protein [Luteococcus sp. Sow4_B9]|uniref:alpha/beta hydrolase fold domain-containing protein n=1 Tax=Luteococcus sp. Sow4_B9 TaxID=3438792 RepID=UPI003F9D75FC